MITIRPSKKRSTTISQLATLIFSFFVLIISIKFSEAQPGNVGVSDGVYIVSELKTKAESRVRLLISLYTDQEIAKKELRKGQLLYEDARAAFNAWLEQIAIELESQQQSSASEVYTQKLDTAAARAKTFLTYVDDTFLGESRGPAADIAKSLVEPLVDAGVKIWLELRASRSQSRERVVERLENLKWSSFDDLRQQNQES